MLLVDSTAYPRLHHPVTQGALCLRGWSTGELGGSPLRVETAYQRRRGEPLRPGRVEEALAAAADRLLGIRDAYGGASIGILGSARITVEEVLLLRRLARALGTPHLDSLQRLGYVSFPPVDLRDIESAPRLTVLGANLHERHPQVGRRVLRAMDRGSDVRVVHARRVPPVGAGALHRAVLPGHELDALEGAEANELTLVSSELALAGQGRAAAARLAGRRTIYLSDYVNQRGAVEAGLYPSPDGLSAWEMLGAAAEGRLKALLVFSDDPFEFFPDLAARAFAGAEFTVVVDAIKTASGRHADVVLPGGLLAEKHGTVVNMEGRAQEIAPIADRRDVWTEGAIATFLLDRAASDDEMGFAGPRSLGAAGAEAERPTEDRPFIAALDAASFWGGHALAAATVSAWREERNLAADFPEGYVSLHREDARELRVSQGARVRIESADGSIALPVRYDVRAQRGAVWIPMSCWERAGSALGALDFDPGLRIPVFRPRAVRVSRAEGS